MRFSGIGKRIDMVHRRLHNALTENLEQVFPATLQGVAGAKVVHDRGTGEEEGAAGAKFDNVDGIRRAGGVAVARHHAERAQAIERPAKGVLADGFINHRTALAVGHLADGGDEIPLTVNDHVLRPGRARLRRFRR